MNNREKIIDTKRAFTGKFLNLDVVTVELPNKQKATRDVVRHPGACAVLAVKDNKVIMEKQYRTAVDEEIFEIPAGKLDKGEDPLVCAVREFQEETGYISKDMKPLIKIFSTAGFSDEVLHIFYTEDFIQGENHLDEDEFLDVVATPIDELMKMIDEGKIKDSKTLVALMRYARLKRL